MEVVDRIPKCLNCKRMGVYAEYYDSYYCTDCNIWLDAKCTDTTCKFCSTRPEFPKDEMGKVVSFYDRKNSKRLSGKNE